MTGHRDLFHTHRDRWIDARAAEQLDALAELLADDEAAGEVEVERINMGLRAAPVLWEERANA